MLNCPYVLTIVGCIENHHLWHDSSCLAPLCEIYRKSTLACKSFQLHLISGHRCHCPYISSFVSTIIFGRELETFKCVSPGIGLQPSCCLMTPSPGNLMDPGVRTECRILTKVPLSLLTMGLLCLLVCWGYKTHTHLESSMSVADLIVFFPRGAPFMFPSYIGQWHHSTHPGFTLGSSPSLIPHSLSMKQFYWFSS